MKGSSKIGIQPISRKHILSKDECTSIIGPAFDQAVKLHECSKILFDQGYYPIAYSLYVLSFEEIGKAIICSYGAAGYLEVRAKHIFSHIDKQSVCAMVQAVDHLLKWPKAMDVIQDFMVDPDFKPLSEEDIPEDVMEGMANLLGFALLANETKKDGFYIGLGGDGEVLIPDERIPQDAFPPFYHDDDFIQSIRRKMAQFVEEMNFIIDFIRNPPEDAQEVALKFEAVIDAAFPIPADDFLSDIKNSFSAAKQTTE